jgi:hypothetical protein
MDDVTLREINEILREYGSNCYDLAAVIVVLAHRIEELEHQLDLCDTDGK